MTNHTFTAVIHKEENLYVADCPELGTVSQGSTLDEAVANLKEASELYLEVVEYKPDEKFDYTKWQQEYFDGMPDDVLMTQAIEYDISNPV